MPYFMKAVAILVGSMSIALGINTFLIPNKVLDGGIIGLGLIISYLLNTNAGFTIMVLSIPIFALAWFKYRSYFFNSLHGMLLSSFFIDLFHNVNQVPIKFSPILSSFTGGVFIGFGIGLMLRFETSTGGTDLLAQYFSEFIKINVGIIIFIMDVFVICLGGLFVSTETFFLSAITISSGGITTSLCTWNFKSNDY
ncbi:YitT family protein [Cytobacillus oceanisediminis]|uniref:YitT family protein n=1 Tax=Niallia alba TaxID=2729105 RepID=A0A7Y0PKP7_9BACI|nr:MULTISPECIES: YitT family protein [Bacillaceae]MBZ9536338.1 YitT family protein [Cytobacillus oceanisediminis]NMO76083.1 YitT family protein [Niallia alba]UTI43887.1 YitT family protein [Niallia sp. RD1]HWJ80277.1 YitT family protein [Niallia sp.]